MQRCYILAALSINFFGCNGDDDRQELINKLRPIGVKASPLVAKPGDTVTLSFYTAAPIGKALTYEAQVEKDSSPSVLPISTLVLGADSSQDYASFTTHTVQGRFVVPPAEILAKIPGQSWRLRYNLKINGDDSSVVVVGDTVVFPANSPEAAWQPPTSSITLADSNPGTKAEVDIAADLQKPSTHSEDYKVGWFVGGGEIKNRRARSTKWTTPDAPGRYTVIFTARGKKTKAFTMSVQDITVN